MIKLQFRALESFLHPSDGRPAVAGTEPLSHHTKRFLDTALTWEQFGQLVACARTNDVPIYATPFDEASVDRCLELGFNVIKVASCSSYDWPLIRKVASTGLPVIMSVGGLLPNEIDDVVHYFQSAGTSLAIMHCVAAYPTVVADLQLDCVRQLKKRYPHLVVGYSGHETPSDLDVVSMAVAKGAEIMERHVGLPTEKVKLNAYSLAPQAAEQWIRTAQRAAVACSNEAPRRIVSGERESLLSLKRGIYARRTIPAGKTITADDVFLAMPCLEGQFHAGKYYEVVDSFTPMRPIYANMPVGLDLPQKLPKPLILSSVDARIKEMLAEAKITLPDDATVELSHQYGFERFFEIGAVLIDVVNRDYCKKILLQFPGQAHPSHRHTQKEETFHILSGSLDLVLNEKECRLEAGQTQLIERSSFHSFSTKTGVIFEEVSTTSIKGDSEYEDAAIPSDPTYRKTRIVLPV